MNLSVGKLEQKNLILNGVQGWAYLYLNISSGEYIKRNQHVCFESFSVRRRFSNAASWLNGFIAETGSSWLTGLDLLIFELVVRKLWSMKIFIVSYDYVEEHERFTDRTNRWVWFHSTKSLCLSLLSKKAFLGWILGFMCSAAFLLRWKHAHVFHCSFLLEEVCLQFPPSIVSTALCGAMSRVYSTQSHERFMDETCRGNHDWVFQLDAEYKRAPGGGIIYCSQCGCFNEQMSRCKLKPKVSVNTRASYEHEGRLLWKSRLPRWGHSFTSMTPGSIRARTNAQQILGVVYQLMDCQSAPFAQRDACWSCILMTRRNVLWRGPTVLSVATGRRISAMFE